MLNVRSIYPNRRSANELWSVSFLLDFFNQPSGGLTMLVKLVMVKCRLVKKTQKIRLFSKFCLESVALWCVSGPGFYSRVSPHR